MKRILNQRGNEREDLMEFDLLPGRSQLNNEEPFLIPSSVKPSSMKDFVEQHFRWFNEELMNRLRFSVKLIRRNTAEHLDRNNKELLWQLKQQTFGGVNVNEAEPNVYRLCFYNHLLRKSRCSQKEFWLDHSELCKKDALMAVTDKDGVLVTLCRVIEGNDFFRHPRSNQNSFTTLKVKLQSYEGCKCKGLKVVQLTDPYFAFVYVLERLQAIYQKPQSLFSGFHEAVLRGRAQRAPDYGPSLRISLKRLEECMRRKKDVGACLTGCTQEIFLDHKQMEAIRLAFTHSVALIQGPPVSD
eukprot:GHVU01122668.1.p1 GENE.GHVU01122668.1~~GHVU01122668.1.p1  ORF type:complete len:299 (+),score=32.76 GHVU01122668.1:276-1172(+)